MLRNSLLLALLSMSLFLLNCKAPIIYEQCTENGVTHNLQHGLHSSVRNSNAATNSDPSDDLKDLHEDLFHRAGEYFIALQVGTPPRTVDLVADTGSSDLVMSVTPTPSAQKSTGTTPLSYGSCNGTGDFYTDEIGLDCGARVNQKYIYAAGGSCPNIWGMGYKALARSNTSTLNTLIKKNGLADKFSFSFCGATGDSSIYIGDTSANNLSAMQKVPFIKTPFPASNCCEQGSPGCAPGTPSCSITTMEYGYYTVQPKGMSIKGGASLGTFAGQTGIVDSGTTVIFVPAAMHTQIVTAIKTAAPFNIDETFFTSTNPADDEFTLEDSELRDLSKLPTFILEFENGVTLDIRPEIYIKKLSNGNRIFGFRATSGTNNSIIFGQALIENYYVLFDRENHQIGFAPSLCKDQS